MIASLRTPVPQASAQNVTFRRGVRAEPEMGKSAPKQEGGRGVVQAFFFGRRNHLRLNLKKARFEVI